MTTERKTTQDLTTSPKRFFSFRRLGERFFLLSLSASLIGVLSYYGTLVYRACHYDVKNKEPFIEENFDTWVDDLPSAEIPEPDKTLPTTKIATVIPESLNVRKTGESHGERIGMVYQDDEVEILEDDETSDYLKIRFKDTEGFVHRDYLAIQS